MIEISNVSHFYDARHALLNINAQLSEHRIGVIGANGSGKSTFARLLNGLLIPDSGRVLVDGLDTREDAKAVRRKVGFVFQNPDNQIVFPVVEEDLEFGLKNLKLSKENIRVRVEEVLKRYRLEHLRQSATHLLSGGEKQMLAISSVLIMEPQYLVLDEPMTLLDLRNKRIVLDAIKDIKQPLIMVTHELDHLHDFDRVIFFEDGQIAADGLPSEVTDYYRVMMG